MRIGATLSALAVLAAAAGCSGDDTESGFRDQAVPLGSFQLVAFDSCEQALSGLRAAAKAAVGPYGFGGGAMGAGGRDLAVPAPAQAGAPGAAGGAAEKSTADSAATNGGTPNYSGTNTHESGVDEPDLVKTDGHRIVTLSGGTLRVVDADTRSLTGVLALGEGAMTDIAYRYTPGDMLLAGDHALVLLQQPYAMNKGGMIVDDVAPGKVASPPSDQQIVGPQLLLISLVGKPKVLSSLHIDGSLVDARQVGETARVVIRSYPRISFPYPPNTNDAQRLDINRSLIDQVSIERWLPRIETTTGGRTTRAALDCDAVSRPAVYSGANLLTVLSFDVGSDELGDGRPTTLVADGDTVYSNGPSLYVASDRRQFVVMTEDGAVKAPEAATEIYKFDTSTPDRPRFVAGGSVPGYLINQYAMSEWAGYLRVATTTGQPGGGQGQAASESAIYVLGQKARELKQVGSVGGLGKRERIYAVRFVGTTGYVVTFRQTDPLYTVDIHDPKAPTVRGELKIPGYSAYLHPAGEDRLIGIGQDASTQGRVRGTQVSLFDVSDLTDPQRIAQYKVSGGHSEAEFDPHAFLYWPASGLLVVPLQVNTAIATPGGIAPNSQVAYQPSMGALVLRVTGSSIQELGFLRHPTNDFSNGWPAPIRRSLVIDQTLWTVSDSGLMANDLGSLGREAWIPFN